VAEGTAGIGAKIVVIQAIQEVGEDRSPQRRGERRVKILCELCVSAVIIPTPAPILGRLDIATKFLRRRR
jgi:hypothetical protein